MNPLDRSVVLDQSDQIGQCADMVEMIRAVEFSPAKARLSELMTRVVHEHRPQMIQRHGGKEEALLLNPDDLRAMLEGEEIDVLASVDEGEFIVSVPTWGISGAGATFDEAQADLIEEAREYVADYLGRVGFYLQTHRRSHALAVLRFALTPTDEQVELLTAS